MKSNSKMAVATHSTNGELLSRIKCNIQANSKYKVQKSNLQIAMAMPNLKLDIDGHICITAHPSEIYGSRAVLKALTPREIIILRSYLELGNDPRFAKHFEGLI